MREQSNYQRARRALLYMPGDDMHKIHKAASLQVDSICMDMEDGVAPNRKEAARKTIVQALRTLDFGGERLVRINAVGSGMEMEDLLAVLPAKPDGIVIPKVEYGAQVQWVSAQMTKHEQEHDLPAGQMILIAIVETALGIVNLREIASADARLAALVFGAEDLAGDIGAARTKEGWEVFHARSAVVTHAAAFNLQAIDIVYVDFRDMDGLREEAEQGARMGFSGKQVIHPAQVTPTQEAFTPSDEEIHHAQRVVEAYEEHKRAGRGAFALDGKMVDAPVVKAARRVLARGRAAGKV